jgi:hypothetical protein
MEKEARTFQEILDSLGAGATAVKDSVDWERFKPGLYGAGAGGLLGAVTTGGRRNESKGERMKRTLANALGMAGIGGAGTQLFAEGLKGTGLDTKVLPAAETPPVDPNAPAAPVDHGALKTWWGRAAFPLALRQMMARGAGDRIDLGLKGLIKTRPGDINLPTGETIKVNKMGVKDLKSTLSIAASDKNSWKAMTDHFANPNAQVGDPKAIRHVLNSEFRPSAAQKLDRFLFPRTNRMMLGAGGRIGRRVLGGAGMGAAYLYGPEMLDKAWGGVGSGLSDYAKAWNNPADFTAQQAAKAAVPQPSTDRFGDWNTLDVADKSQGVLQRLLGTMTGNNAAP